MRKTNGITLIALIITVIVMLILVAVTVSVVINSNLIGVAQNVADATEAAYENEKNLSKITIGGVTYPDLSLHATGWDETIGISYPRLAEGMKAVYWDNAGNEIVQEDEEFSWNNWFDYEAQATGVDGTSRWANAKTEDGSYWVWIPRFEYKITPTTDGTPSETNAGTIDVRFISTETKQGSTGYTTTNGITTSNDGYIIHPAFTSNVDVGGFGKELAGFWVAKYEMSQETSTDGTTWTTVELLTSTKDSNGETVSDTSRGNIATTNAGNSSYVRAVSKPNVGSWRWINIANMYTNAYYYDRNKDSHLMKNSEWGAVAYLTHSQYGRNGNEIYTNNSADYITGNSGGSVNTPSAEGTTFAYNTENGKLASSTGNITGIYDLSGGASELVAAFNSLYSGDYFTISDCLDASGKHFATTGGKSTKYATAYKNNTNYQNLYENKDYSSFEDFENDGLIVAITGDAIKEVGVYEMRGWFNDNWCFVTAKSPFFWRGGNRRPDGDLVGVFFAGNNEGYLYNYVCSFRVVCAP